MVCSQPLFPAARGGLATGDGESEEDPDRTRLVSDVRGVSARLDGQVHVADAYQRSGRTDVAGSREAGSILPEVHLRRGHRSGFSGQRSNPEAEDAKKSSAEG